MTAADKRVEELLERWMASLELHARYLKLDDAAYARVEAWPKHQRPTKWVVELARQRLLELRARVTERRQAGDGTFAESLELMAFLTGLLGSEHLERYIPLATGKAADAGASGTVEQPRMRPARARTSTSGAARAPEAKPAATAARPGTPSSARGSTSKSGSTGTHASPRAASRPAASREAAAPARPSSGATDARTQQVIADAVRMLEWGREWPALAGLIARMADRPSEQDVWKILRAHRSEILVRARRPAD